jgi:ATP-dependent 26S proteasome regulatory subunit
VSLRPRPLLRSHVAKANRRRYIHLQEEYIKDEQRSLKRELVRAQEEIKRIQSVPLVIGQFMEAIDQKYVSPHIVHVPS